MISCGGGVVVTPSNYQLLRQNGKLVYLTRPLEDLAIVGRPLSERMGVQNLAAVRIPLYEAWADVTFFVSVVQTQMPRVFSTRFKHNSKRSQLFFNRSPDGL